MAYKVDLSQDVQFMFAFNRLSSFVNNPPNVSNSQNKINLTTLDANLSNALDAATKFAMKLNSCKYEELTLSFPSNYPDLIRDKDNLFKKLNK